MPLTPQEQIELDQLETEFSGGLTPAEEQELADLESEFGGKQADFAGRMQADMESRNANTIKDLIGATASPLNTIPYGISAIGQQAGKLSDAVGNAIGSVGRTVAPEAYEAAQQKIAKGLAPLAEPIQYLEENAPRASKLLGGGLNLLGVTSATELAAPAIAKKSMNTLEKLAKPKQAPVTSTDLRNLGTQSYEAARASGEMFPETLAQSIGKNIEISKPKGTGANRALTSEEARYIKSVDEIKAQAQGVLGIDDVDRIDKNLTTKIREAYKRGEEFDGSKLEDIQDTLRESIINSPAGQKLAEGRKYWATKYKMEDIETIFRKAENKPNSATAIQSGFARLAERARKNGNWTKEELALIDKGAKDKLSVDALKILGSRLIPIVTASGGNIAGAAAANVLGVASRAGATAVQKAAGSKLVKEVTKDITKQASPTKLNKAAQSILDRVKRGEKVSPAEINKLPAKEGLAVVQEIKLLPAPEKPAFGAPSAEAIANKENILNPTESIYNSPINMVSPEEKIKEFGRQRLLQAIREKKLKANKK